MRLRVLLVGILVGATAVGVALTPATATSHVQISADDSQPVPERSFEFRNTTYRVDSVVVANASDEINVSVTGPDDAYRVYIYNSDEQLVDSRTAVGNDTFTFDLDGYDAGSYVLTVYQAGDYEAIEPLLVEGYDVDVDIPERSTTDESLSIRVGVERNGSGEDPAAVKAVLSSGERDVVVNATESGGEYTATLDAGALEAGNYTVYGVVQGERQVFGRNEMLGLSDRARLSVENETTNSTDEASATTTRQSTPTPTPTATATAEPQTGATATPTEASTDTPAAETQAPTAQESAITPNMDDQTETTTASGPGFTAVSTAVALGLAVVLWSRRD